MSEAEATNAAYEKELQEASAADLTLVRGKQVVHVVRNEDGTLGVDSEGSHIVMLTPSLIPNDSSAWEKAFKLFLLETQELCKERYRIVYIHSGFSPPIWFGWWLLQLRGRLSRAHRKNVSAVTVIHPTLMTRSVLLVLSPVIGAKFWQKLHYADRVEELWLDGVVSEKTARDNVPQSVVEYESKLVEEMESHREIARMLGAPLGPREGGASDGGQE